MAVADMLNGVAVAIQLTWTYLQKNAWPIIFLLVAGYYLKTMVLDKMMVEGPRDSVSRTRSLEDDMRRVRLQQQELAQQRALEAQKERQQTEAEEKKRKAEQVKKKKNALDDPYKKGGKTLGYADDNTTRSYNALNPNNNPTSRYRPSRRTTRRG